ncbi:GNAT family N-acetyltransferase, partial [Carnobacterium sp.]|uniref:GNAT family N-acetyltransferase n=1 Tax=Carnobacterium sp. TaxID=48221 RepID=UPI0028AE11C5
KKELKLFAKKQTISLIPVTEENKFIAQHLEVTDDQKKENLVLSVPEAIQAANDILKKARPFFINLNNTVIGYTAFVFDKKIEEEYLQYWLWQFMIDEKYQGKGYASLALEKIMNYFEEAKANYITLSTKPTNKNAIRLYKKFGFFETGKMNGDEVILQKNLTT